MKRAKDNGTGGGNSKEGKTKETNKRLNDQTKDGHKPNLLKQGQGRPGLEKKEAEDIRENPPGYESVEK